MNSLNKPVNNTVQADHVQTGQLNHVQVCQQAKTSCAFLRVIHELKKFEIEIESTVRTKALKGLLQIAVSCATCDAEKETSISQDSGAHLNALIERGSKLYLPKPRFQCNFD